MDQCELTSIEQRGRDTLADLEVQRDWLQEGRFVSVEMPRGEAIQIKLSPVMSEGKLLRLKGKALAGGGDLLIRICVAN